MIEQTKAMLAYSHWLYNANSNFVEEIWAESNPLMAKHFREKLNGLCNRYGGYMSVQALAYFDRELSIDYQADLYEYILKNHTNKWY